MKKSGQLWKFNVFLVLMLVELCLFVVFVWRVNHPGVSLAIIPDQLPLALSFIVAGALGLAWLWFSIVCSHCHARVAAVVLNTSPSNSWLTDMLTLRSCPKCGATGEAKA
jgi:hypothetical protein